MDKDSWQVIIYARKYYQITNTSSRQYNQLNSSVGPSPYSLTNNLPRAKLLGSCSPHHHKLVCLHETTSTQTLGYE